MPFPDGVSPLTGHEIGLLKAYMQDLVEQARQDARIFRTAGFKEQQYNSDQALMDLLAILDDRLESEGIEAGLTEEFCHRMWEICRRSRDPVRESSWVASNLADHPFPKSEVRSTAYRALIDFIEREQE